MKSLLRHYGIAGLHLHMLGELSVGKKTSIYNGMLNTFLNFDFSPTTRWNPQKNIMLFTTLFFHLIAV